MNLIRFLKEKQIYLLLHLLVLIFLTFLFHAMNAGFWVSIFVCIMLFCADILSLGIEFWKKNAFYKQVENMLDSTKQKYLVAGLINVPDFYEGEIFTDSLHLIAKSMNDALEKYRIAQDEYREYIETWIHEVKIPISCIALQCENHAFEESSTISRELKRIENDVEQALFYARSFNVEKDYLIREINLNDLVHKALKSNSQALISCKPEIETNGLNQTVFADPKWLDFILNQILSNSIKYRQGSLKLCFTAFEKGNSIFLEIADNGIGIPKQDINRVFEKGFTGENGRKFAKSTGIGLYLCNTLCQKMNLKLSIRENTTGGTVVSLCFPKDRSHILFAD